MDQPPSMMSMSHSSNNSRDPVFFAVVHLSRKYGTSSQWKAISPRPEIKRMGHHSEALGQLAAGRHPRTRQPTTPRAHGRKQRNPPPLGHAHAQRAAVSEAWKAIGEGGKTCFFGSTGVQRGVVVGRISAAHIMFSGSWRPCKSGLDDGLRPLHTLEMPGTILWTSGTPSTPLIDHGLMA